MADIYEQWRDLRSVEEQFNQMESNIRQLASGWLLATLGGIAFILQGNSGAQWLVTPPEMLISFVSLMGMVGISVLWIQDQLVFHRLLNSAFLIGLKMEYDHHSLPPLRSMMMIFSDKAGMAHLSRLYYLIPIISLALICVIASCFFVREATVIALLVDGTAVASCIWVHRKGKSMERFSDRAQGFDKEFVDFLQSENYETQLEKYVEETRREREEATGKS